MRLFRFLLTGLLLVLISFSVFAQDNDFPEPSKPPRLVNDFAGMMSADEVERLEQKLVEYDKSTSTQIAIVTIKSLGSYDVAEYGTRLAHKWEIGQAGKDNGVLILASLEDRKMNISSGYGLEGSLTDIISGRIIRNEMVPEFKKGDFYTGFDRASDAIIAATKGEYKAEENYYHGEEGVPKGATIFFIILIIIIVFAMSRGGGGNGGGGYMSRKGHAGDILSTILLGEMLGGGRRGRGGFGGGGGFGGFGGGGFGGGGASGSW